ncbi:restriction endonuclease subunit S [Aeromonas veronii]|uniref:restriction endonuclease subunit S n=1 Tax=Aeromonas veronii TaxID=654 RepID=UPI001FD7092E|nr:restriction endonuclease subunit S [Aeromonas veronii]MCJ8214434.1 restriction endonuclease subunit S [Aeromonas veronii]
MTWPMVKLKNCCTIVGGATPRRDEKSFWDSPDIPWVTPKDISNLKNKVIHDTPEYISQLGFDKSATFMLPEGSVLLTSRAPIGNLAVTGKPMCTNQGFKSLVPNPDVDCTYLYYCMLANIEKLQALGNGATFKEVSKKVVEDFEIPLPPLDEQKRIAAILDKADAIRQKRQQAIALADDFLRSVFLDMFGDPVTNPKGWDVRLFGDISDSQLGKMLSQKSKGGNSPKRYLRNANIRWRHLDLNDLLEMDFNHNELLKFKLEKGDLLVCEGGEIGRCAIWNEQINDCYYQKALHRVRPNLELVTSIYLQEYLYSMSLKNAFSETVSEVTFSHLTSEKIKLLRVPVPPLELQKKFNDIYDKTLSIKESKYQRSFESQYLFEALAQKAFSGQL